MPDLNHVALEATARKFDAAGQLNMFVGTSVVLALLEERKRLEADVATIRANRDAIARGEAAALQLMAIEKARATAAEAERDRMKAALFPEPRRLVRRVRPARGRGGEAMTWEQRCVALARAIADMGQDAYENGRRSGFAQGMTRAANIAWLAALVPPDGGEPSEEERRVAQAAHDNILAALSAGQIKPEGE